MKKLLASLLAVSILFSTSISALAATEYYAVVTNTGDTENPDPVYILLDDTNSTETEGTRVYTGELAEGRSYEIISEEVEETVVYQITGAAADTADLTPGENYTFAAGSADIEVGQVLEKPLENGAILTYVGDGKTQSYIYGEEDESDARISTSSVSEIFQNDIKMIEEAQESLKEDREDEERNAERERLLAGGYTAESYYLELVNKDRDESERASSYEDVADAFIEMYPQAFEGADREAVLAWVKSIAVDGFLEATREITDPDIYNDLLDEMKAIDAEDEEAILAYLGMSADEVKTLKGNLRSSNTPVVENSGIVTVVTPGAGFDNCDEGAIFYREDTGWSYACLWGGVGFGDSAGLKLYSVEANTLDADAFTVTAGDTVQLDKDGKAVAGLKNVKATVKLPNNEVKELISFEFKDDKVNLNDPHVTAIIGGRYYTVTLDLKEWIEEGSGDIPIIIEPEEEEPEEPAEEEPEEPAEEEPEEPAEEEPEEPEQPATVPYVAPRTSDTHETLAEICSRMNSTADFAGAVKDIGYQNAAYKSEAILSGSGLRITAKATNGQAELRRLIMDKYFLEKLAELKVQDIIFCVGGHTLTIDARQFKGLSDVAITLDPQTQTIEILVGGADRTADFAFTYKVS